MERFKYKTHLTYLVSEETMEKKIVEIGTISARGQIAIPAEVRRKLQLDEGERVLFVVNDDALIIKRINIEKTWAEVTKPLREAVKKAGMKEEDVVDIVHRFRQNK